MYIRTAEDLGDVTTTRVGQIAQQIERDPILRARLEWQERVNGLAQESGLDPQFVGELLVAYDTLSKPAFPGRIDPRSVPFIQLEQPLVVIAKLFKDYLFPLIPVVGATISLHEAYTGKDLVTQERLPTWHRVLVVALAIAPFVSRAVRPIARAASGGVQVSKAAIAAIAHNAKQIAALALELRVPARTMLRFVGKLARVPVDNLRRLLQRVEAAQKARRTLQLTSDDAASARVLNEAFREFNPPVTSAPQVIAAPTARAFIFLNRDQPLFLGRLLGRRLSLTTPANMQAAERAAADVARRIRIHWDAAVSKDGGMEQTVRRIFERLKTARPTNPNEWVRENLFKQWRQRAMRRIYNDRALVRDLMEKFGVVIGKNPKTGTISMHIRTKSATSGGRVQTPLDFDHATVGHANAVAEAMATNDFRRLISTVDSGNLQLLTGRENRNFIEAIRKAQREMGVLAPPR
jgi:Pre-toxin TG